MARIAVTGAAGSVGRTTLAAFEDTDHDVTPITHRERDLDSIVLEVEDRAAVADALAGHDAVIHLAGNPSPDAEWDGVLGPNVDGTYSVYEAAVEHGLDRVVFASTNHVHQYYNVSDPARPESVLEKPRAVAPDEPPRPDSYYAVSKVAGEALGTHYADRYDLDVVNLRIGWLLSADELRAEQDEGEDHAQYARAMWLSPRDCRHGMRRAVAADLPENPLNVPLTSANREHYLSLTKTRRALDYAPRDDSAETLS